MKRLPPRSRSLLGLPACLGLLAAGCAAGSGAVQPAAPTCAVLNRLELHAHRGSDDRPENMVSAFQRAVDRGADMVELDLQVSRDDHLIVAHDAFMRADCRDPQGRALAGRVFIRDLTAAQAQAFDCGARPGAAERVATLPEVFRALGGRVTARGRPVGLNIELKYDPASPQRYPGRERYAALVLQAVRASAWDASRILLQSFDIGLLEALRAQGAAYRLSPLLSDAGDGIATARRLRTDTVTPHHGQVTPEMLAAYRQAGLRVIPWTVNDVAEAQRLIDLGVDGLITDRLDFFPLARHACRQG
ncbi:MAG: glycerophosphodiester phosphodiesterase family protein [Roseateles sp.]|uniref:glycerophosphodiester phosphodiesterase n=1 Tax=Roseateles sp. TaxID=1971397 RepID=UPI0039EA409C